MLAKASAISRKPSIPSDCTLGCNYWNRALPFRCRFDHLNQCVRAAWSTEARSASWWGVTRSALRPSGCESRNLTFSRADGRVLFVVGRIAR